MNTGVGGDDSGPGPKSSGTGQRNQPHLHHPMMENTGQKSRSNPNINSINNVIMNNPNNNQTNKSSTTKSNASLFGHSIPPPLPPPNRPPPHQTLTPITTTMNGSGGDDEYHGSAATGYYACSRYFLFLVYLILLVSLILNTFLHFIFYGSNMSIGSIFLDVHHRHELITGEYYTLEYEADFRNAYSSYSQLHRNADSLHCDRNSFLTLLEEFYHQYPIPKPPAHDVPIIRDRPRNREPTTSGGMRKIFSDFHNLRNRDRAKEEPTNEEDLYYSSSTSIGGQPESRIQRLSEHQWKQKMATNEHRLLVFEVIALILLFITVVTQVLGMIAVIRKHLILLIIVTVVDTILFCNLVFLTNTGLLILLLMAICGGYLFIYQLKIGLKHHIGQRTKRREEFAQELQQAISQNQRLTPCIHVSMEQYETMTQQMLQQRYSSPIVYCPHYNESLC